MITNYVVRHPVVVQQAAARYSDFHCASRTGSRPSPARCYSSTCTSRSSRTLVVSLEAIFLSTFVMIGQNRQAAFHEAKADHDFVAQEQELEFNTELTEEIHELTLEMNQTLVGSTAGPPRNADVVRRAQVLPRVDSRTKAGDRAHLARRAALGTRPDLSSRCKAARTRLTVRRKRCSVPSSHRLRCRVCVPCLTLRSSS